MFQIMLRELYDEHRIVYMDHIRAYKRRTGDQSFFPVFPTFGAWVGRTAGFPNDTALSSRLQDAFYMKGGAGDDSIYSYRCPHCLMIPGDVWRCVVPVRSRQMQAVSTTGCISFDHTFDVMKNFKGAALKTVTA